jgi:RimJ/RimL family protein N-acetyltransferase
MVRYVRHAESREQAAERYEHFREHNPRQFRVVGGPVGEEIGWMAYWERIWNDEPVLEIGWAVHPEFHDRNLTEAALEAIASARSEGLVRYLLACPWVDNDQANAICRTAGFTLIDTVELPYAPESFQTCNVWRLDLA